MGKRTADSNIVAKRLKKLRVEKGNPTQKELSVLSGVPYISIGRYERGETVPESDNLLKLASFFQVDPEYILGRTDFKNIFDKWNQTTDLQKLKKENIFWKTGFEIGLFPEIQSEDDYKSFINYLKYYEIRKEMRMKKEEIKVVLNATENRIIDSFETGEITIYAVSEADVEKGFQHLMNRGIIAE